MTRNTKLYKTSFTRSKETFEVIYRDLTSEEVSFILNIKNDAARYEISAATAITNIDPSIVPIGTKLKIGEEVLRKATELMSDIQMLEIAVSDYRKSIQGDDILLCIKFITRVFPGQSITDLLKLTHKDLIELVCLCEDISGKQIFTFGNAGKKGMTLVNPHSLPDDGKSLQQKMNELNTHLGQ